MKVNFDKKWVEYGTEKLRFLMFVIVYVLTKMISFILAGR